ncbi:uncharacterized protein LOC125062331 [Pieris napi]|uniref:uncharacterized protein LOC125062331 n=1 Tax=Pieris napi TaxID=78633 RepID=UPI001FBB549A|nr:uncharacterized protein LOC125062331 [Pieris napi]
MIFHVAFVVSVTTFILINNIICELSNSKNDNNIWDNYYLRTNADDEVDFQNGVDFKAKIKDDEDEDLKKSYLTRYEYLEAKKSKRDSIREAPIVKRYVIKDKNGKKEPVMIRYFNDKRNSVIDDKNKLIEDSPLIIRYYKDINDERVVKPTLNQIVPMNANLRGRKDKMEKEKLFFPIPFIIAKIGWLALEGVFLGAVAKGVDEGVEAIKRKVGKNKY